MFSLMDSYKAGGFQWMVLYSGENEQNLIRWVSIDTVARKSFKTRYWCIFKNNTNIK